LVKLPPRLELLALALGVLAASVQLLEHRPDQVHAVDGHAIERGELGEVVGELSLQPLGRLDGHAVDDDVAQVLVAVADVDGALGRALLLAHRIPGDVADLLLARRLGQLAEESLRFACRVAGVGHDESLRTQPMHADALRVGPASSRPAVLAELGLVHCLPLDEQSASVLEDILLDVGGDGL
jgi:hypothetical protein